MKNFITSIAKKQAEHRSPAFLFVYSQRLKKSLLTAFIFSGWNYTNGNENERQRAKNGATEGNGNEGNTERPTETAFLRLLTAFNRFTLTTTPPNEENTITAKINGFTAHGLQAPNGSRTNRTPQADQERQPKTRRPSTELSTSRSTKKSPTISRAYLSGNCRGNLSY